MKTDWQIISELKEMLLDAEEEQVLALYNKAADMASWERIYANDIDELLSGWAPMQIAALTRNSWHAGDDWVIFEIEGLVSFNDVRDYLDGTGALDDLARMIVNSPAGFVYLLSDEMEELLVMY